MAITYDSGSNTITVTGSATFADIQTANDNGSWGVCTHTGDFYLIEANLVIGDGSTTSNLTDSNLQIQIGTSDKNVGFTVKANATLSLDNFSLIDYTDSNYEESYGTVKFSNGIWKSNSKDDVWLYGIYQFYALKLEGVVFVMQSTNTSSYLKRITSDDVSFYVFTDTTEFDDLVLSHPIFVDAGRNPTITNSNIDAFAICSFWLPDSSDFCDVTFIDCVATSWSGSVDSSNNGDYLLHQIQTFKTIISSGGNNIQGANVFLKDINDTEEFSVTTDANGTYPIQQAQQATYNRAGGATPTYFTPHTYRVRKYGYVYVEEIKNISDKVREGTVIKPNGAITESDKATALGYTGITIDKTNKTITINDNTLTILKIYDYCQAWLMDNMDVEEFLTTTSAKAYYVLHNNWTIVLQSKVTGYFNITGTINLVGELDLDDITITGDLHINTSTNSALTFNNIKVNGKVYNDDANHTLTINAQNGSSLTANNPGTGAGQVNILSTSTLTITNLIPGSIVEIYDNEIQGDKNRNTRLAYTDNSDTSFSYVHDNTKNDVIISVIKKGYVEIGLPYTIEANNQTIKINQKKDIND